MGGLFVVATPIGNLEDITLRALRVLKEVDLIACEDTRQTAKLLARYQISRPTVSYHQHSRIQKIDWLIEQLKNGKNIALVSDAGTPGISDPGFKLVEEAQKNGIKVETIPGPSAVIAAASVAGLPVDQFVFLGFPPHKKGRETFFKKLAEEEKTAIFYESTHRFIKALDQLEKVLDKGRQIVVCRELTKKFEEVKKGNIEEIKKHFENKKIQGEFVILVNRI
ncbi:MAG: 16S rRNA (cytidine(1402)-2'-O)-methyltransferase [bacterium]